MATKITKNFTLTTIKYSVVTMKNGEVVTRKMPDKHFTGTVDEKKAYREITKELGPGVAFVITAVETSIDRYEIDLDTFINNAVKVNEDGSPIEGSTKSSGDIQEDVVTSCGEITVSTSYASSSNLGSY